MSDLFPAYCELISSPAQIARCKKATSVSELLAIIKDLWQQTTLGDDQLLAELAQLNQQIIDSNNIQLAGHWLPYRYQPRCRRVYWLLPDGHATEPFQDETISRYRQHLLLNQIIQPCTSLSVAQQQAENLADIQPAGFIFHLSRCGSTLISGCLSELETTCVFSESPLLTELLLDGNLLPIEQQAGLRAFINLQANAFTNRPQMIIKWNAWDIFRWELIREIYPQVPGIFLVRNPVEILASHERGAGRHMSGDLALAGLNSVFVAQPSTPGVFDRRIQILGGLLQEMSEKYSAQNTMVVDYRQLSIKNLVSILPFLVGEVDELGFLKIQERLQFHSKAPRQVFVADSIKKQHCFTSEAQQSIHSQLMPTYNQLILLARKIPGEVINVG